jgi:hypothetical protein
MAGAHSRD